MPASAVLANKVKRAAILFVAASLGSTIAFSALGAQQLGSERTAGAVIAHRYALLGPRDTIAIDQFMRDGTGISGEILRQGVTYRLMTDKSGSVVATCLEERSLSGDKAGTVRRVTGELSPRGVMLRTTEAGQERVVIAETDGRAALYVPMVVASVEQLIRTTPLRVGDSARVLMSNFRYADTLTGAITRFAVDSFRIRDSHNDVRVGVSNGGELLGYPYPQDTTKRPRTRLVRLPDGVFSDTSVARLKALAC